MYQKKEKYQVWNFYRYQTFCGIIGISMWLLETYFVIFILCCPEISTPFWSVIFFQNRWKKHDFFMKRWQMFLLWCPKTIQNPSGRFRPPRPIFNFFVVSKKLFFGGILLASESPYLRVVNFTTILDMFFICNGKFILDIFNKNQITIKIVCTMRNVTKSIPPKKCFFWNDKKLKIGRGWPKSAGRVLNCFGTSQQKHLTPFHNKIMLRSSILKKYRLPKGGWLFLHSTV